MTKLIDERGNEYSVGARMIVPERGTYERDQLERQADTDGCSLLDDAEYYGVHVMGPDGYEVTNTDARHILYWPAYRRGCVLETTWCYYADGNSAADILAGWFHGS